MNFKFDLYSYKSNSDYKNYTNLAPNIPSSTTKQKNTQPWHYPTPFPKRWIVIYIRVHVYFYEIERLWRTINANSFRSYLKGIRDMRLPLFNIVIIVLVMHTVSFLANGSWYRVTKPDKWKPHSDCDEFAVFIISEVFGFEIWTFRSDVSLGFWRWTSFGCNKVIFVVMRIERNARLNFNFLFWLYRLNLL